MDVFSVMIYKYKDKYIVFPKNVLSILNTFKQFKEEQHEAGGILLGKVYEDSIIIDTVSTPSIEDKSGRYFFERNVKKAQEIVRRSWNESGGERIYLGEWHTHPEGKPIASTDDKKLIKNMLHESRMEINFLIMLIVGTSDNFLAIQENNRLINVDMIESKNSAEVLVYQNRSGNVFGFTAIGYTGFAKTGYDIYNASLSTIFQGTVASIVQQTDDRKYVLEKAQAYLKFVIPSVRYQSNQKISLLFNSMMISLNLLLDEIKLKENKEIVVIKTLKV
jgi:integrative and conjugative element protein (TIGR02256 family)